MCIDVHVKYTFSYRVVMKPEFLATDFLKIFENLTS
jgi:hypothetical protein